METAKSETIIENRFINKQRSNYELLKTWSIVKTNLVQYKLSRLSIQRLLPLVLLLRKDVRKYLYWCIVTSIPLLGSVSRTVRRLVGGLLGEVLATTEMEAPTVSCGLTPESRSRHSTYVALYFKFQFSRIAWNCKRIKNRLYENINLFCDLVIESFCGRLCA